MPRYFIHTTNHVKGVDEEGSVLPDLNAVRNLLRRVLIEILSDEGETTGIDEYVAEALDERGHVVMKARISFSVSYQ